jgi:uncharacterized membrane protein YfcA
VITDPAFYATAVVAVLIVGVAKGGLAGGIGIIGVPLMSLTIGPIRAAAIMLPILMAMDVFAVRTYWRRWDEGNLRYMIPGALLGTVLGTLTFRYLSADALRLLIGVISVGYSLTWFFAGDQRPARSPSRVRGTFWSTLGGFTSFSVHAGGPPIHVYLLSQRLDKTTFQATTVAFFFLINWVKLGPYAWLGQLDLSNLKTSLVLAPLAPLGIALGVWLHHRIDETWFFRVVYASLLTIGAKLIHDGAWA